MKITIDTKEDSHEEIRKIIGMLHSLVGSQAAMNMQENSADPEPIVGEGIFGMFSDNKEERAAPASAESPTSDEVAGMFSENREEYVHVPEPEVVENVKKESSDDEPRIVTY